MRKRETSRETSRETEKRNRKSREHRTRAQIAENELGTNREFTISKNQIATRDKTK
jgi:hypothetical protein